MIEVLKLVFKKWVIFLITIPPIISSLTFYFPEKNGYGLKIVYWVSEYQFYLMLGILIFAMFSIIVDNLKSGNLNEKEKPKKVLKSLPANIELETIQKENFEWVFKVGRYFTPDSKPEEDKLIEEIDMSKTRCIKCKSKIKKGVSAGFYNRRERFAQCPNQECELNKKLVSDYELENIEEQEKINFKSKVRLDFKKYWKIYYDEYYRITGGKFDEYQPPIRKTHRR